MIHVPYRTYVWFTYSRVGREHREGKWRRETLQQSSQADRGDVCTSLKPLRSAYLYTQEPRLLLGILARGVR
ncbi:hypothetical protein E2C01_025394 [Portunus trituberculatus]|uniref:Uncharacterized protein n=1 Tax=Portunus trituberculatus TaxID=210409 RepID=A0A5B7ECU5_PORTR|nr:hypothetical protein [Portunus trituberculatus]